MAELRPRIFVSKSDVVTDSLRELIASGELPAGMLLRQRQLAQQFNVSETPVREALRRLESEGLVTYDVHRGSRVANVNVAELEENYRILAALDSLAAGLAAEKITEPELEEVRALAAEVAALGDGDPALKDLNRRFHFRIYECARSPLLLSLMRLLWRAFPRGPQVWRPYAESVEQHERLIAALAARDADAAADITRQHVLGSIAWMRTRLQASA